MADPANSDIDTPPGDVMVIDDIEYAPDPALSFWPTPREIADELVVQALCPGYGDGASSVDGEVSRVRVLEPSAGEGHLVRVIRAHLPASHITGVEPNAPRAASLRAQAGVVDEVVEANLETFLAGVALEVFTGQWRPFDLVLMNPPFALEGRPEAWAEHILALYTDPHVLAPGGVLGAVVPRIVLTGTSKLVRAVRKLLGTEQARYPDSSVLYEAGRIEPSARGAFAPVGAGVSTALIWAYKPIAERDV